MCFRSKGGVCLPAAEAAWQEQVSYYNPRSFRQLARQLTGALLPSPQSAPRAAPLAETDTFLLLLSKRTKTASPGRARQLKVTLPGWIGFK